VCVLAFWTRVNYNATNLQVRADQLFFVELGVMPTHEALNSSYVGEYGWYALIYKSDGPGDIQGNGTHVMGTILGQGGIGVAPGAKWMACQNIPGNEAEDLECGKHL